MRPARAFLALFAMMHRVVIRIHEADLDALVRDAGPFAVPVQHVMRRHEDMRTAFRGAVGLAQQEQVLPATANHGLRNGSTTGDEDVQRRAFLARALHVVQQVVHERRGTVTPRNAFAVDELDGMVGVEVLLQHHAGAHEHIRDEAMVEARGVVQRGHHDHDVRLRAQRQLRIHTFGELQRVMRHQHLLRLACGAGRGQDADGLVGLRCRLLLQRLVRIQDLVDGDELIRMLYRSILIKQRNGPQRGNAVHEIHRLLFVIRLPVERRAQEHLRAYDIHNIGQVLFIEVAGQWMHDGAHLQGGNIHVCEVGPDRHLPGNNVAGLDTLLLEPGSQTRCLLVNLGIGETLSAVVTHIFAIAVLGDDMIPNVVQRFVVPIALAIVFGLTAFIDFQIGDHDDKPPWVLARDNFVQF